MKNDIEVKEFSKRDEYRNWLKEHHLQENGIWILFNKGSKIFSANDALEESICFGWIDGVMKSIDDTMYRKYFSRRKDVKKWSEKNKALYKKLIEKKLMTESGREVYHPDENTKPAVTMDEMIQNVKAVLIDDKDVLALFNAKPLSRQKQFAGFYSDAKTEETKSKRKIKIVEALKLNYSGMLY
ncbi:MAG TPA: YdeI/OmpD-associated family protein [Treponemataceae bacterium]|nr:YdeI/OmpD-associated family protein [Treponemataceae bacterium]HQL04620.1 YdeI/OmpD-associated family protein [Treponemataceae bacterium]